MNTKSSNGGRRTPRKGSHSQPTTRAGREEASRRAKERERKRRYREVLKAAGSVPGETPDQRRRRMEKIRKLNAQIKGMQGQVEKLKGSPDSSTWRRPHDPRPDGGPESPQVTSRPVSAPESEPARPELPATPSAPEPTDEELWEGGVDPVNMARDKERCNRAAREAIEDDERKMRRLIRDDPDVAPCRLCGEPDGLREHCWVCERCYQGRSWPFGNDPTPVDFYTPTIYALLDRDARLRTTRIKSPCSVEGCDNKVPTPEGIRDDATCDKCYRVLFGESRLDRSIMGQKY